MVYTKEKLEDAAKNSVSIAGMLRYMGLKVTGGTHCHIRRRLKKFNIDISHFTGQGWSKGQKARSRLKAEEILVNRPDGDKRQSAVRLRRSLLEIGREYKCAGCGNPGEWLGEPMVLQVDHINGDWLDDRAENLRFMCPNCHHQTSTFGSAKLKKDKSDTELKDKIERVTKPRRKKEERFNICIGCGKKCSHYAERCKSCAVQHNHRFIRRRPSQERLEQDLIEIGAMTRIGDKYGVSDNAVRKWLEFYNIKHLYKNRIKKKQKLETIRLDEEPRC